MSTVGSTSSTTTGTPYVNSPTTSHHLAVRALDDLEGGDFSPDYRLAEYGSPCPECNCTVQVIVYICHFFQRDYICAF